MLSFLLSGNEGYNIIKDDLNKVIDKDTKVFYIPWSFPFEIENDEEPMKKFFDVDGKYYKRIIDPLKIHGIKDENVFIANCYTHSASTLKEELENSDMLVLAGGNPVMLTDKIEQKGLSENIKKYKGIVLGGSAGACTQFPFYFITPENNGPRGLQELEGLGILDIDFLIDVHTNKHTIEKTLEESKKYFDYLKRLSKKYNKKIYAINDDGAIIVNRENNNFKLIGNVIEII